MKVIPYVSFNGNCEEAMAFYQRELDGSVEVTRFEELPADANIPISESWKKKIMHGALTLPTGAIIYCGDTWEDAPVTFGSNTTIHIQVDTESDVAGMVDALSEGGEVTMPAESTFWGSTYGSLVDKYGVHWGIEFEHPESES